MFIGIIIGGVMYFMAKKMSFNSDTTYGQNNSGMSTYSGGKKHMKDKYSNRFCTPTKLNLVLALVFAYIVYSNFIKN
jgi:hypothetical protein